MLGGPAPRPPAPRASSTPPTSSSRPWPGPLPPWPNSANESPPSWPPGSARSWRRTLADAVKHYDRDRRDINLERSLEADLDRSATGFAAWLAADQTSPSGRAERNEELMRMVEALAGTARDDARGPLILKHCQGLPLQSDRRPDRQDRPRRGLAPPPRPGRASEPALKPRSDPAMSTPSTPTNPTRSTALIAAYVQAIEAGQVPNRRELLDRHPEQAEALQTFFADFDRMDRVAAPLRIAGEVDETAALEGQRARPIPPKPSATSAITSSSKRSPEAGWASSTRPDRPPLNRLVALKMILAGTFATPRDVARFQAEAEAAANLDHPHIVPVYEVGEHEGQQYFSMKFVEGGSLANHPRGRDQGRSPRPDHHRQSRPPRPPARSLAPGSETLERPGRPQGRPPRHRLRPRQTPDRPRPLPDRGRPDPRDPPLHEPRASRRPERPDRRRRHLRPRRDPLRAPDRPDPFRRRDRPRPPPPGPRVRTPPRPSDDPSRPRPRPRNHRPQVPRKRPTRRYPTAEELAQDLTRWLEGRPIHARPVTQAEKFARWCRRNPAVAGLAASVALALLLGATLSTRFAFQERKARIRAQAAEAGTERAFARSLARPLDLNGVGKLDGGESWVHVPQNLSEPEVEALWELAGPGSDSLKDRFLDEAIADPFALRQVYARSEPAMIATAGLDPDRRARVLGKLADRFGLAELPVEEKVELAFLILQIEDGPSPRAEAASRIIIEGLAFFPRANTRLDPAMKILDSSGSLLPARAASLIVAALGRSKDPDLKLTLAKSLTSVASLLDAAEAAAIARPLAQAIEREEREAFLQTYLAEAFAAVSKRLGPVEAAGLCVPHRPVDRREDRR